MIRFWQVIDPDRPGGFRQGQGEEKLLDAILELVRLADHPDGRLDVYWMAAPPAASSEGSS